MKMKRILGVILVGMLAVAGMHTMAYAASENYVSSVPTLADEDYFNSTYQMNLKNRIANQSIQQFELTLKNGDFAEYTVDGKREDKAYSNETALTYGIYGKTLQSNKSGFIPTATSDDKTGSFVVALYDANSVECTDQYLKIEYMELRNNRVTCELKAIQEIPSNFAVVLYLNLQVNSSDGGNVKLIFDGENSTFSSSGAEVGVLFGETTRAKILDKSVEVEAGTGILCAPVEIRENSIASITGNQILKLSLPTGVEWSKQTKVDGRMISEEYRGKTLKDSPWQEDGNYENGGSYYIDKSVLYLHLPYGGSAYSQDEFKITPVVDISKSAEKGFVSLSVKAIKSSGKAIEEVKSESIAKFKELKKDTKPTPAADAAGKTRAVFKIGEAKYSVDKDVSTMDGAPFIDENNRTMVPIRYVANALKVSDDGISYNNATRTATIVKASSKTKVKITTGEKMIAVSKNDGTLQQADGVIPMDTVAVNRGGRIYVPARYIAEAFEAEVVWNQSDKTIEISYK